MTAPHAVATWTQGHEAWTAHTPDQPWLHDLRAQALARFASSGFPTTRDEAWHYTSLRSMSDVLWVHAAPAPVDSALTALVASARFRGAAAELVFVNGRFEPGLSALGGTDAGQVAPLSQALTTHADDVRATLGGLAAWQDDAITALNVAFLQDGVRIHVPRNVDVAGPVHVIVVGRGGADPVVAHLRNLIVAEPGSRVTVAVSFVGDGGGAALYNVVDEVAVGANAEVTHVVLGNQPGHHQLLHRVEARLERDARYHNHAVWVGGELTRSNVRVTHAAPGAQAWLDGVFVIGDRQHVDCHTVIDHAAPRCTTREIYKGVLGGAAKGIFDGTIMVRPDAQQTDAVQDSRNLLLSDSADANVKPTLEIYADDVKCAHGTTVGRLDPVQLAYLRMRGLPPELARRVLTAAFVADRVDHIADPAIQEHVRALVEARLVAIQEAS